MRYDDKTCAVCCEKFETTEGHNKHYEQCVKENSKTDYTEEEIFNAIHNEKRY